MRTPGQIRSGSSTTRTLEFFGLNMLQDRRPEYYGLLADKAAYYKPVTEPLTVHHERLVSVPLG